MLTKSDLSDLELIKRAQRGDREAFDAVVIKYQTRIYKIVHRFVQNSAAVKDVSQDVFIKAYNALDNFRGESAFYTWLYRIAVNTAKTYATQAYKENALQSFDATDPTQSQMMRSVLGDEHTPEWLLAHIEMHSALYDAAENLPNELRVALLLREVEGFSYDEIAEIMQCPLGTVRSRIYRARETVLKEVKEKYAPRTNGAT